MSDIGSQRICSTHFPGEPVIPPPDPDPQPAIAPPPTVTQPSPTESQPSTPTTLRDRARGKTTAAPELPPLAENTPLKGRRGNYRVSKVPPPETSTVPHKSRRYEGVQVPSDRPFVIQQYWLSDRNLKKQIQAIKERLGALATLNFRTNAGQDFRLVSPWDAFVSEGENETCSYLITEPIPHSQSLRHYLASTPTGTMSAPQVRIVLDQVLQTLWFLHNQRIRLPDNATRKQIAHGNLTLDSLLIVDKTAGIHQDAQFLIYATDLALWEHLFLPTNQRPPDPTPTQDLKDLGTVAFQLLTGNTEVAPEAKSSPVFPHDWLKTSDRPLKQFIHDLVKGNQFKTADDARQALRNLAAALPPDNTPSSSEPPQPQPPSPQTWGLLWFGVIVIGGVLTALAWNSLSGKFLPTSGISLTQTSSKPKQPEKTTLLSGEINYLISDVWKYVLQGTQQIAYDKSLEDYLKEKNPELDDYKLLPNESSVNNEALVKAIKTKIQDSDVGFGLINATEKSNDDLEEQIVAYDGLAIFVAFSDAQRKDNIPKAFQGRITVQQLEKIYTANQPTDAGEVAPSLKGEGYKIKPYIPSDDQQAQELFKNLVLPGREISTSWTSRSRRK